jgi:hypothetical protein
MPLMSATGCANDERWRMMKSEGGSEAVAGLVYLTDAAKCCAYVDILLLFLD